MSKALTIIYYGVPGRAESTRIMLDYGKIPFEEQEVTKDNWAAIKPTLPLGEIPVLVLDDGRMLAQSGAIERYVAKLVGLYPTDPLVAGYADMYCFLVMEVFDAIAPSIHMPDMATKIKVRQELLAGKVKDKMLLVNKQLESHPYLAGQDLSFADITAFAILGILRSGELTGIPKTLLDDYPAVKAWYNRVASLEPIKERYAAAAGYSQSYKPE